MSQLSALVKYIPDAAWPYLAAIIGAIAGCVVSIYSAQSRASITILRTNQEIIKEQLRFSVERQSEAIQQQEAIRLWLSSQLNSCKEEIEKLKASSQLLEDELNRLKIENARLIERLETKDFN